VEDLQTIPLSVSAFDADEMIELGWDRSHEIAGQVPNMQVSAPYGDVQPLFAIRGISMVDYSPSQSSPIGIYVDEGYLAPTYTHGLSMFDLERIEVLRGPQGTLYGKNTTGGAINFITATPEIGARASGDLTVAAGNFGMSSADATLESGLIDGHLAGRIAINYKRDDGYWRNSNGPDMAQTDFVNGRVTLNFEPNDHFSAVLKLTTGKSDGRATPPRIMATAGPGITVAGRRSNTERHAGGINRIGPSEIEMTLANLHLSWDWNKFSLVSVSSFVDAEYLQVSDPDGTTASLLGVDWGADTRAFAQDLRLVSDLDGPVSFIAGIYYGKEDTDTQILHADVFNDPAVKPTLTALGLGAAPVDVNLSQHLLVLADALPQFGQVDRRFDVERESLAIYGSVSLDLNDRLQLGLGIRYTDETNTRDYVNYSRLDQDGNGIGSWVPGNLLTPQFNALGVDAPFVTHALSQAVPIPAGTYLDGAYTLDSGDIREQSEGEFSGRVSVDYRMNDATMIYASYSRGYRSGSFNNGLVYSDQPNENGTYVKPEFIDAWEVGFKSDFMDKRIRLNGAVFRYDYTDQQFINQIGISAQLVNAGGAELKGVEFELTALVTDRLTVRAGLGLLDTEYKELELPRLSTPLDAVDTIDLAGNELVSSPKTNFNYAADYEIPMAAGWYLRLHLDGGYIGDQWFSAYNALDGHDDVRQRSYWLHNARITYASADGKLALSLWGQNILDQEYDVFAINLQSGFGYNYFLEGRPRTYGVEATYRFN